MVEHANKLNWHIQTYLFIVVLLNRLAQREAEVDKANKKQYQPSKKVLLCSQ